MDDDMRRRMIHGLLSLALGLAATWLATYITNKILGEAEQPKLLS